MKYPPTFDWSIVLELRKTYAFRTRALPVHTVGAHGHGTFREWADWLRTNFARR